MDNVPLVPINMRKQTHFQIYYQQPLESKCVRDELTTKGKFDEENQCSIQRPYFSRTNACHALVTLTIKAVSKLNTPIFLLFLTMSHKSCWLHDVVM